MKELILSALQHRSEPYSRKELLLFLRSKGQDATDRQMRHVIAELIEQDEYCIQASKEGYSLINDVEHLKEAVEYLRKKAKSIAVRHNCLIRNYRKRHGNDGQLQLDLFPEI